MTRIVVGQTTFRDIVMDYNPIFRVTRKLPGGTYEAVSEDEEVCGYAGVARRYSASEIKNRIAHEELWSGIASQRDDFWANRTVGEVLHYCNGHNDFVRGVIVLIDGQFKLKPTALVGNWSAHDLPSRRPNGDIYYPYHADKVVNGGDDAAWQCSDGCVYESPTRSSSYANGLDPRTLHPIDLTVPGMTADEQEQSARERLLLEISGIINNRHESNMPPGIALVAIGKIVERYKAS